MDSRIDKEVVMEQRVPRVAFDVLGQPLVCDGCKQIIYTDMAFTQVFGEDVRYFLIFCDPCFDRFEAVAQRAQRQEQ
jgi:hypothetical protein